MISKIYYMFMKKRIVKKIIVFCLIVIIITNNLVYAKINPFEGEVEKPVAESNNNVSSATIYDKNPYSEYNPINPTPTSLDKDEYDSVDNYNVDFNTLETRIKYFSPSYLNIKSSAESSLWMAYYAKGGSAKLDFGVKDFYVDYLNDAEKEKKNIVDYKNEMKALDKTSPTYIKDLTTLVGLITSSTISYKTNMAYYSASITATTKTLSSLNHKSALYRIANVDNNTQVTLARNTVCKKIRSAILSYLTLKEYVNILEKQTNLYYNMYELNVKNNTLGLATDVEVSSSLDNYEDAKATYKKTKNTMNNVLEQIADNLGYKITDIDKINFVDPEIDFDYITNIKIEDDRDKSYNSNALYKAIQIPDKDKKLPGSTGENLYRERQKQTSEKIIIQLEALYQNLQAELLNYDSSKTLKEICDINEAANKRKFDNNLVSELEYDALELQNLSNKLTVVQAKYNLIEATDNYYYATCGIIE